MGARGPVPNRSENLSRDRDSTRGGDRAPITKGTLRDVTIPEPDPAWHPIARMLWDSMIDSGQADFFQSSDWAYAFSVMDDLSLYKQSTKRSSMMFAALESAFARLLITEADRRRARIELQAPPPDETPAAVLAIADYKEVLGVTD